MFFMKAVKSKKKVVGSKKKDVVSKEKIVRTNEELEREVEAGAEKIVLVGRLAQQMNIAFKIKKYGWAVVVAFIATTVLVPGVGLPLSASIVAAITAIGASLFKEILSGYEIEEYFNSPMKLILKKKAGKEEIIFVDGPDEPGKVRPSVALAEIVGSKPLSRNNVTKKLWEYIKENDLQDPKNSEIIIADDKLLPIFGGKKKVTMFKMTLLVQDHLE